MVLVKVFGTRKVTKQPLAFRKEVVVMKLKYYHWNPSVTICIQKSFIRINSYFEVWKSLLRQSLEYDGYKLSNCEEVFQTKQL